MKIYIGLFVILIGIILAIESSKKKPIDWTPTFNDGDKSPWGTYVLHEELTGFFPENKIENIRETPYEFLNEDDEIEWYYDENTKEYVFEEQSKITTTNTYLFVDANSKIDNESIDELLRFTATGNKVFIAAQRFPNYLEDTLRVKTKILSDYIRVNDTLSKTLYFTNEKLQTKYEFEKGYNHFYFEKFNTENTKVLGFQNFDNQDYINYIQVAHGKGSFYLNTQPYAFTNYHLLKENHADYVSDVFSYLNNETIYWDSKYQEGLNAISSPLRFIMSVPALRLAWYWGIVGLLLFVFFMARRRQRIVPIIEPLPNTSVEFAKTIGNLYYQEGKPKDIITKKIVFFLEKIRKNYMLDTQNLNEIFINRLHHKTGIPIEKVEKLINYIIFLNKKQDISEVSLVTLNKMIDAFYEDAKL